jgi:hypothetical protein
MPDRNFDLASAAAGSVPLLGPLLYAAQAKSRGAVAPMSDLYTEASKSPYRLVGSMGGTALGAVVAPFLLRRLGGASTQRLTEQIATKLLGRGASLDTSIGARILGGITGNVALTSAGGAYSTGKLGTGLDQAAEKQASEQQDGRRLFEASLIGGAVPALAASTYAAVASIPLATYGARKMLGGYEKQASKKSLLSAVASKARGLWTQEPLFGRAVANRAKQHGVIVHNLGEEIYPFEGREFLGALSNRIKKLGDPAAKEALGDELTKLRYHAENKLLRGKNLRDNRLGKEFVGVLGADNPKAVNIDLAGAFAGGQRKQHFVLGRAPAGAAAKKMENLGEDKLLEAAAFPELIPRTENLGEILRKARVRGDDYERVVELLNDRYNGRYIIKPRHGYATVAANLPSDKNGVRGYRHVHKHGLKNSQGGFFPGKPSKLVVQERLDIEPLGRHEKMLNNFSELRSQNMLRHLGGLFSGSESKRKRARGVLSALGGGKLPVRPRSGMSGGLGKEMRVHVIDGKVVPYASGPKGTKIPPSPENMRRFEKALQKQLDQLDPKRLKGTFGVDVVKLRDGSYRVIEMNPTTTAGASGGGEFATIQDALAAAVEGRLPNWVKWYRGAQLGAGGTAAAGGYGAYRSLAGGQKGEAA